MIRLRIVSDGSLMNTRLETLEGEVIICKSVDWHIDARTGCAEATVVIPNVAIDAVVDAEIRPSE